MSICADDHLADIIIRDVPEPVLASLQDKARLRQQSFQDYLTSELHRVARGHSLDAILAVIDAQPGGRAGFLEVENH